MDRVRILRNSSFLHIKRIRQNENRGCVLTTSNCQSGTRAEERRLHSNENWIDYKVEFNYALKQLVPLRTYWCGRERGQCQSLYRRNWTKSTGMRSILRKFKYWYDLPLRCSLSHRQLISVKRAGERRLQLGRPEWNKRKSKFQIMSNDERKNEMSHLLYLTGNYILWRRVRVAQNWRFGGSAKQCCLVNQTKPKPNPNQINVRITTNMPFSSDRNDVGFLIATPKNRELCK